LKPYGLAAARRAAATLSMPAFTSLSRLCVARCDSPAATSRRFFCRSSASADPHGPWPTAFGLGTFAATIAGRSSSAPDPCSWPVSVLSGLQRSRRLPCARWLLPGLAVAVERRLLRASRYRRSSSVSWNTLTLVLEGIGRGAAWLQSGSRALLHDGSRTRLANGVNLATGRGCDRDGRALMPWARARPAGTPTVHDGAADHLGDATVAARRWDCGALVVSSWAWGELDPRLFASIPPRAGPGRSVAISTKAPWATSRPRHADQELGPCQRAFAAANGPWVSVPNGKRDSLRHWSTSIASWRGSNLRWPTIGRHPVSRCRERRPNVRYRPSTSRTMSPESRTNACRPATIIIAAPPTIRAAVPEDLSLAVLRHVVGCRGVFSPRTPSPASRGGRARWDGLPWFGVGRCARGKCSAHLFERLALRAVGTPPRDESWSRRHAARPGCWVGVYRRVVSCRDELVASEHRRTRLRPEHVHHQPAVESSTSPSRLTNVPAHDVRGAVLDPWPESREGASRCLSIWPTANIVIAARSASPAAASAIDAAAGSGRGRRFSSPGWFRGPSGPGLRCRAALIVNAGENGPRLAPPS